MSAHEIAQWIEDNYEDYKSLRKLKAWPVFARRRYQISLAREKGSVDNNIAKLLKASSTVEFHATCGVELVDEGYFSLAQKQIREALINYVKLEKNLLSPKYPGDFSRRFLDTCKRFIEESVSHFNLVMNRKLSSLNSGIEGKTYRV
ncbi:hypothetical protein HYW75_04210 [Candidatus Pacearchaeota archaeon]|nr:hypothetical protein [Candidatus Pacearchaeota archaeon]